MCSLFHCFKSLISEIEQPKKLNFPFYYTVHPLAEIAMDEVQKILIPKTTFNHDFGIENSEKPGSFGKMFGVLVVQNLDGELGYLAGFSGKIGDTSHYEGFVPPVFDMLGNESYFRSEEKKVNSLHLEIEALENSDELVDLRSDLERLTKQAHSEIDQIKNRNKEGKSERDKLRKSAPNDKELDYQLSLESKKQSIELKLIQKKWTDTLGKKQVELDLFINKIQTLKEKRAQKSNTLQKWLFKQYTFLNGKGENKSLLDIFESFSGILPPAGAGECVAPKLFQYAYLNQLKPITFAEFWWGKSPASEIRKHRQFYPSCRGKCEPILGHMLEGIAVDPNPMLENPAKGKTIRILFDDDYLAVIHKPNEFLSVPGKKISDSVYVRVKKLFPEASGPLCVHRLDMSTSGLMLIAKDLKTHEKLQRQFLKKTIKKRYVAILDGELNSRKGEINLPLRVDLNNRPQQMVCYEHGKEAKTYYEVLSVKDHQTKIYFYPITGRTHQLRVHAAHPDGLNAPIKGDDLYGNRADRLYLQAQRIEFYHPVRKETIVVEDEMEF